MKQLQWITMNPDTKEGVVIAPSVPPADAGYWQTLEWAALRHLMLEVRESGGGDMNLNTIYIKACVEYCTKWVEGTEAVELESPPDSPT
jgi:hypothetical protein